MISNISFIIGFSNTIGIENTANTGSTGSIYGIITNISTANTNGVNNIYGESITILSGVNPVETLMAGLNIYTSGTNVNNSYGIYIQQTATGLISSYGIYNGSTSMNYYGAGPSGFGTGATVPAYTIDLNGTMRYQSSVTTGSSVYPTTSLGLNSLNLVVSQSFTVTATSGSGGLVTIPIAASQLGGQTPSHVQGTCRSYNGSSSVLSQPYFTVASISATQITGYTILPQAVSSTGGNPVVGQAGIIVDVTILVF